MKILFINPPIQHAVQLRGPNRVFIQHESAPPLGLMYLSSYLKSQGSHEVRFINGQAPGGVSDSAILKVAREWRPDVVGFTVNVLLYYNCCRIAGLIKQALPQARVVFGGPHLTEYAVETVSQPMVDFGVFGEGEYTFHELLLALEGQSDFASISGLVFKRGGEVIKNAPRQFRESPDDLPMPDYSLYDFRQGRIQFDDVGPTGLIITSRGCPYHCTFCCLNYPYYRARSARSVVDEMVALQRMGCRSLDFFDDNFNVSRRRVREICELIRESKLDIPWSFRGRVDKFDEQQARMMAEAGCIRASFGVEHGNQQVLDRIRKDTTIGQIRSAFANAKRFGIQTVAYCMVGLPDETREQARDTVELIFEIDPDYLVLQALVPQPGSQIYRDAMAAGAFDDYFREFALHPRPELHLRSWETAMTEKEIFDLMRSTLYRFYLRPSYLLKSLRRVGNFDNFITKAVTAGRLLFRLA